MKFKVGDRVRISRNVNKEREDGANYEYLDQFIGAETTLLEMNCVNSDGVLCWWTDIRWKNPFSDTTETRLSMNESNFDLI